MRAVAALMGLLGSTVLASTSHLLVEEVTGRGSLDLLW